MALLTVLVAGCDDDPGASAGDLAAGDLGVAPDDLSVAGGDLARLSTWERRDECTSLGGACVQILMNDETCGPSPEYISLGKPPDDVPLGPVSPELRDSVCSYVYATGAPYNQKTSICCRPKPWPCSTLGGHCSNYPCTSQEVDAGAGGCWTRGVPVRCCAN